MLGHECLRFIVAEYYRGKRENIGIFILPAISLHPSFGASSLEELDPIPLLLHRHLREQDALVRTILHQQAVLAHLDLAYICDSPKGREN